MRNSLFNKLWASRSRDCVVGYDRCASLHRGRFLDSLWKFEDVNGRGTNVPSGV